VKFLYSRHARRRLFERSIPVLAVERTVMQPSAVVEEYPDDQPYPSRLLLGWSEGEPLHVVAARADPETSVIVTVYRPNPAMWEAGFSRRRSK
jgi:hypothetical protein